MQTPFTPNVLGIYLLMLFWRNPPIAKTHKAIAETCGGLACTPEKNQGTQINGGEPC